MARAAIVAMAFMLLSSGCRPWCVRAPDTLTISGTAALGASTVLEVAGEMAPCRPRGQFGPLRYPVGRIGWRAQPWESGGILVAGTSASYACGLDLDVLTLEPATRSALAHEVGHWFWSWCHGRPGEVKGADGRARLDPDLAEWVASVNLEAARRLGL